MKRLLAVLLIVLMITPLVACNGNNSQYTTLKCIFLGTSPANADLALVEEEMNKITREKLGVELDITILDAGSMSEKLNIMMGSGEQIDVVWTGYAFDYAQCIGNGGLYEITDLMDQVPGIKEHVSDDILDLCYVDDGLYGIPNMQLMCAYYCYVFPKALVEKYNFDYTKVETPEDLEPYLEALAKNEPDIYPIADNATMGGWSTRESKNSPYYEPYDNVVVNIETGEISMPMDIPFYRERMERAVEWYKKGYIRKDIMTVTDEESARHARQVGVWAVPGEPGLDAELTDKYGYEIVSVPSSDPVMGDPTQTMLCVGSNTVDPLKSLQVIELLNTDVTLHNLAVFGIEGKHYNRDENGKVVMVKNSGYDQSLFSWVYGDQFNSYLLQYQPDDLWEVTKEMNANAAPDPKAGFVVPTKVADQIKNEVALLSALGGEYAKGLRFGTLDLDEALAEYKDRAMDMFYEIRDAIKPYVKEWIASKNK